jgi:hypothetical protein
MHSTVGYASVLLGQSFICEKRENSTGKDSEKYSGKYI